MKILRPFFWVVAFGLILLGCRKKPSSPLIESGWVHAEEFEAFYERFHRDSTFQMDHIVFPLEGIPDNADPAVVAGGTFRWTPETWRMNRPIDLEETGFRREIGFLGNDILTERLVHESGDYAMMRRFARMGEEWYLIYYAGLNAIVE